MMILDEKATMISSAMMMLNEKKSTSNSHYESQPTG